jgi:hypothetical protein
MLVNIINNLIFGTILQSENMPSNRLEPEPRAVSLCANDLHKLK